jgi:two-component system, NarL family, sensor kinase
MDPKEKIDIISWIITGGLMFSFLALILIIVIARYLRRKQIYLRERADMKSSYEKAILQSQLEIKEQTVHHISQELHDNVGQLLSLAIFTLSSINPEAKERMMPKVNGSRELVQKAVTQIRDLAKTMDGDNILSSGIADALKFELQLLQKNGIFKTQFKTEGTAYPLDPQKELVVFRVTQEILNNIVKHAQASSISAFVRFMPNGVTIAISDDGIGFDLQSVGMRPLEEKGSGITNIHKRMSVIGGRVQINSETMKGTNFVIDLPST